MAQTEKVEKKTRFWPWIVIAFILGVGSVFLGSAILYWSANSIQADGRLPARKSLSESELKAARKATFVEALKDKRTATQELVDRMYRRQLQDPDATMNFLILSGGGENGAFGAGFLLGWSSLPQGELSMPQFDGVTGVSAGSYIAPFAYLGTQESLEKIDRFFRNPGRDWLKLRSPIYLLPELMSVATVPGLERALREQMSMSFAKEIVKESTPGRVLMIQASNLDLAIPHIFNFIDATRESVKTGDFDPMIEILLASSAIPGLFPPREINGSLYVDGGVVGNFYTGGRPSKPDYTFGGTWKREHPDLPIPKTRYWVILNGNLREAPKTSSGEWPAIVSRSLAVSVGSSEVVALRELYALAELTRQREQGEVEVRWVAIEEPLAESVFPILFDQDQMRRLSDLGKKHGADSTSWNTQSP